MTESPTCEYCEHMPDGSSCEPWCPKYSFKTGPTQVEGTVSVAHPLKSQSPDNASYFFYTFANTETEPVKILGKDENRCRAVVWVSDDTLIGRRNDVKNNKCAILTAQAGAIVITNKDEMWALHGGGTPTINVINERWT